MDFYNFATVIYQSKVTVDQNKGLGSKFDRNKIWSKFNRNENERGPQI